VVAESYFVAAPFLADQGIAHRYPFIAPTPFTFTFMLLILINSIGQWWGNGYARKNQRNSQ
jgi:hypothetical protein